MGGGLESRCVGRVYGADGAVRLVCTVRMVPCDSCVRCGWCRATRVYGADGAVARHYVCRVLCSMSLMLHNTRHTHNQAHSQQRTTYTIRHAATAPN
jgi:hypothetical protein